MILIGSLRCWTGFGSRAGQSISHSGRRDAMRRQSGSPEPPCTTRRAPCGSHTSRRRKPQLWLASWADPAAVRLRMGTRLWLGDEFSRQTTATVLDVHPVRRGERAGYRQRVCPADGWIVVIAGGTSHGIGMEAPTSATTLRQRAIAMATGSLGAAGLALSPYTINGKKRWFLEPPHML